MNPAILFLIDLIIWVLIIGGLFYILRLVMNWMEVSAPVQKIILVIATIIVIVTALSMVAGFGGAPFQFFGQPAVVIRQGP